MEDTPTLMIYAYEHWHEVEVNKRNRVTGKEVYNFVHHKSYMNIPAEGPGLLL
jgi:hypothetical protein